MLTKWRFVWEKWERCGQVASPRLEFCFSLLSCGEMCSIAATLEGSMPFSDFLELMSEIMMQTTRWGNLSTKLNGYVGFDTIQEQIKKKSLKRGFELNLMVVGEWKRKEGGVEGGQCGGACWEK